MKEAAQEKMQAIFKSRSERFLSDKKVIPGPGSYDVRSKLKVEREKKRKLSEKDHSLSMNFKKTTPSIPTDNLGYKLEKNEYKKVDPEERRIPVPGSYEIRKDLKR